MSNGSGGTEHRVRIRADGGGSAGHMASAAAANKPEKWLNRFVRSIVLMERLGNALGTMAFTWATVVLLGGYAKDLTCEDDFKYATIIVFLEAARMLTRDNRLDYRLFFNTRGAFRPVGRNGLIMTLCFFDVFAILWNKYYLSDMGLLLMALTLATVRFLSGKKMHIDKRLRRATSLCSPLVAILLMAPPLSDHVRDDAPNEIPPTRWIIFTTLLVPVTLVTISRLPFTRISKLVDSALGGRKVLWCRVIINSCMVAALGTHVFMLGAYQHMSFPLIIIIQVGALAVVSFGNFQIPAAVVRVALALWSLEKLKDRTCNDVKQPKTAYDDNLVASLRIFYVMVLGQGLLYLLACVLEFFSFIPRRSLVRSSGFRDKWGLECVNLYYAHAIKKCMQGDVLALKKISLPAFATHYTNSHSSKKKLYGIRMMHSFLQRETTILSKLTNSVKTVARIIRMMDWTCPEDAIISLYAVKVTVVLAKNLSVVTFPGTIQILSALLDADSRPKRGNPLFDTYDEEEKQDLLLNTEDSQDKEHAAVRDVADNQEQRRDQLLETGNLVETQARSTQPFGTNEQNCMLRCWKWISEFWSVPQEQLSTDHDLLPALAMEIIGSLAGHDQDNCVEISKDADLIPKIIGFASYRSDTMNTEAQQKVLLKSSLKVLQRLTSIDGEIGITLRYKISKHPFLLRNLTEILGHSMSSQEFKKLVAVILKNLAVDGNTRQEIGRIQPIITMLMQLFLSAEAITSNNADHSLQKVAGQALAVLTTESEHSCFVMLKEPELIKKLTAMILINDDKYIYVAASLLRNLCLHAGPHLTESDKKELHHPLQKMFKRIMVVEGAELEILIGLSSQICEIIPDDFARELHNSQIKRAFVKRLVIVLNDGPSAHCPGIRRVILEQVICMANCNYQYADCFNEFRMIEALSTVEQTLSKDENYRIFLGNKGFMAYSMPISILVAKAKNLWVVSRD